MQELHYIFLCKVDVLKFDRNLCKVYAVIDGDFFEVQIFQLQEQYKWTVGKPTIVVAKFKKEGTHREIITSLNPEAKGFGIKRLMSLEDGQARCEELCVIRKKFKYDKASNKEVERMSVKIRSVLLKWTRDAETKYDLPRLSIPIERNGSDEYFIDLTKLVTKITQQNESFDAKLELFDEGVKDIFLESRNRVYQNEKFIKRLKNLENSPGSVARTEWRLGFGALITTNICEEILKETKILCTGGVGTNKVLCKLASKLYKPDAVCALTKRGFFRISANTPFTDLTGLGGDRGTEISNSEEIDSISQLRKFISRRAGFKTICEMFEDKDFAKEVKRLCYGVCFKKIVHKLFTDSVSSGRKNLAIFNIDEFKGVLNIQMQCMLEKLEVEFEINKRYPTRMQIEYKFGLTRSAKCSMGVPWNNEEDFADCTEEANRGRLLSLLFDSSFMAVSENETFSYNLDQKVISIYIYANEFVSYADVTE